MAAEANYNATRGNVNGATLEKDFSSKSSTLHNNFAILQFANLEVQILLNI